MHITQHVSLSNNKAVQDNAPRSQRNNSDDPEFSLPPDDSEHPENINDISALQEPSTASQIESEGSHPENTLSLAIIEGKPSPIAVNSHVKHRQIDTPIKPQSEISFASIAQETAVTGIVARGISVDSIDINLVPSVLSSASIETSARLVITPQLPPQQISHPALQIVAQNLLTARETQKGIIVRLDPPEMGRVYIDFQFESERAVTAIIKSEFPETSFQLKNRAEYFQSILKDSGFEGVTLNFEHEDNNQNSLFNFKEHEFESSSLSFTNSLSTDTNTRPQKQNIPRLLISDAPLNIWI